MSKKFSSVIQSEIRVRANYLCEYCHALEKWQYVALTIDHVIPLTQGGDDSLDNLALACFHCNRRKGNLVSIKDLASGDDIPLFHPWRERWQDHFIWSADGRVIISLTAVGKVTIAALDLNRERVIDIRQADILLKRHPPPGDPVFEECRLN